MGSMIQPAPTDRRRGRAAMPPTTAAILLVLAAGATVADGADAASVARADVSATTDGDWPSWRGPTHDGHAAAGQDVPIVWSADENVLWRVDVPGRGSSSPTVVGDRVFITTCDETSGSQSVIAFDRETGRPAWSTVAHDAGAMRKNTKSTGASGTVACDGNGLFVAFANADAVVVTALSMTGERRWQTRLCDYVIHQGYGASPFVYGDTVIVIGDNKGGGAVAALDRRTGRAVWKRQRPSTPNYSSPVVYRLGGRDQLILIGCDRVMSLDPATGETIWEREGATTECVTTPVTDGERVFTSGGYPRNHVAAVRADGSATIDWENGEREYVPSMLVHGGHLYGVLDAGIAVCWEAATGAEKWKQRLGGTFSGSPVLLDGRIFVTSEAGATHVFAVSPAGLEPLAVNTLGDEAFASPTICGNRIYLRYATHDGDRRQEHLACIGRR
jgi:outer membrane protein assembly factor BamB